MPTRIALVFTYPPRAAGGFNESLSFLKDASQAVVDAGAVPLVIASHPETATILRQRGHQVVVAKPSLGDRFGEVLETTRLSDLSPRGVGRFRGIEVRLKALGVVGVVFLSPSWWGGAIQSLPFSTCVWDVNHLDEPSQPELREHGEFGRRERFLSTALRRADFVVVPDTHVRDQLGYWGFASLDRVVVRPFRAPELSTSGSPSPQLEQLFGSITQPILFYPAYYWPHKNHAQLMQALATYDESAPHLLLTGGDRRDDLLDLSKALGVSDRVTTLGYLSESELAQTYQASSAILMPTRMGPSNLPPLEAWHYRRPLVYNDRLRSFTHDAAEHVDVDDPLSIRAGIDRVLKPSRAAELVENGSQRLEELRLESDAATQSIARALRRWCK